MKKRKLQPTKKSELIAPLTKISLSSSTYLNKSSYLKYLFKASISHLTIHLRLLAKTSIWTRGISGTFPQHILRKQRLLIMGVVVLALTVSYSDGWRYLEAAPSNQGEVEWGSVGTSVGGTDTAIGSGKSNTEKIVTQLGSGNYAAQLCSDLELGGYDDCFLPSKDELNELYKQKDTVGGFASYDYWSSSEISSTTA